MPIYLVKSPSGQELEIEGDSPPTEKELDDIFASVAPKDTPAPVVPASTGRNPEPSEANDFDTGMKDPRTGLPMRRDFAGMERRLNATADLGIRAGGPAAGQSVGAMTGPAAVIAVPALGALGGAISEYIALKREGKDASLGKIIGAAISGAIPGASMAKAGMKEVAKEGTKYAGGELVARTAESEIDRGELPSAVEAASAVVDGVGGAVAGRVMSRVAEKTSEQALNEMRDQSFRDVREFGIVVPPSEMGKGSDTISSMAGKAATTQVAAKRNQFGWQKAVREELGLGREALPISKSELKAIREESSAPYQKLQSVQAEAKTQLEEQLASISKSSDPHAVEMALNEPATKETLETLAILAAADVDALKEARKTMQRQREAFFSGNPEAYEPWQAAKSQAEALENAIEKAASILPDKKLPGQLKEARKRIATTYSVEDTLNPGNGFVDPAKFGSQLLNGEPLSGNLEKIAKFQLAFRREAVEAGRVPAPGVGNLGSQLSMGMASQGDAPGMIGAVANATVGRAARPFLLSDFVQNDMLNPVERQNFASVMARYLAEREAEQLAEQEVEQSAPAQ